MELNSLRLNSYCLRNKHGVLVEVLNKRRDYKKIATSQQARNFRRCCPGFSSKNQYLDDHPYFGALAGRFANRIAHGKFTLEGKEYSLAQNNGTNHLHGGLSGFDKVFWEVEPLENQNGIQLSYTSKDGEEGYPGSCP